MIDFEKDWELEDKLNEIDENDPDLKKLEELMKKIEEMQKGD